MNGLDLFSGIGGISLALREWVRPIAYCEIDPYCQGVLLSRMLSRHLSKAPIWDDVRTIDSKQVPFAIDIIYGGFPCQDISIAGRGKGLAGERSGLFYEIVRLCSEIKPRFIFLENVPAITSRGGTDVVREITALGYDCRWCIISAASVGALHKRERWFLLAHASGKSADRHTERAKSTYSLPRNSSEIVSNPKCKRSQGRIDSGKQEISKSRDSYWWEIEPSVGRMADGIPNRVDRLRALGNAVVPQQAKEAFKILMGIEN